MLRTSARGTVIGRTIIGLVIAAGIAFTARRLGALGTGGAVAALSLGTIAIAAGWSWGALLIAFFVGSSILSRIGDEEKQLRTADVVAKGKERDAIQVLANGGVFGVAALLWLLFPSAAWLALGGGALAAATADTWGTEVGTLSAAPPRMITTWDAVPPGTSGAVSAAGIVATVCGAAFIALLTRLASWPEDVGMAVMLGGISGALADSFLGAWLQARRYCPVCETSTERHVHRCGTRTNEAGGVVWLDNDVVNLLAAVIGGGIALVWWLKS